MTKTTYSREELGSEIVAPSGYYQPLEEATLEYAGRLLLYTLGSACIEASCCGVSSWDYARVEGYVVDAVAASDLRADRGSFEVDTVDDAGQRAAIASLLEEKHPSVRVEFR